VGSFNQIKQVSDLCGLVTKYDGWSITHGRGGKRNLYIEMLFDRNFQNIDEKKMEVVIYLFQHLRTCEGPILPRTRTVFSLHPQLFVKALERTSGWKSIVDDLSLDWKSFSPGLLELGASAFEKEVKAYATSLHEEREGKLGDVAAFLSDPVANFDKVRHLDDLCLWIGRYDRSLFEAGVRNYRSLSSFFQKNFHEIDEKKVEILIHMNIHCGSGGLNGEILGSQTARIFRDYPQMFIEALEKNRDWKKFINGITIGWRDFSEGLAKLGDSGFEQEIRKYVDEIKRKSSIKRA
jgi:hypothetical protein